MTDTATVEALTAEVRVLMVGNRQITLSVYRQLDRLDPDEINRFHPFGRVNSGTKYDDIDRRDRDVKREAHTEFIGKDTATGALVRMIVLIGDFRAYLDQEQKDLIRQWRDLPLIVLAGLR